MSDTASLKILAQRVLARQKAGQSVGHQRDSGPGQVSQAPNQVGHLQPADFCGFEATVPLSHAIGLGQRDTSRPERDSAWDSAGTVDADSGLPAAWSRTALYLADSVEAFACNGHHGQRRLRAP